MPSREPSADSVDPSAETDLADGTTTKVDDDGDGDVGDGPDDDEATPAKRGRYRWLIESGIIVVVAVCIAILLRTFVVQTFYIPSLSMYPTLNSGDRILVNKLAYEFGSVDRGDIVVFSKPPLEDCGTPVKDLVKRVIGLPGDVISLHNGNVYIDGHKLAEPWLAMGQSTEAGPPGTPYSLVNPYKVPAGDYYVMGDNRLGSCDSRYWGPIKGSTIVGQVILRIWPPFRVF